MGERADSLLRAGPTVAGGYPPAGDADRRVGGGVEGGGAGGGQSLGLKGGRAGGAGGGVRVRVGRRRGRPAAHHRNPPLAQ